MTIFFIENMARVACTAFASSGSCTSFSRHPSLITPYLTGIIKCWYGVPAHMTYGTVVSGFAPLGY